jgi:hypothetical protein
LTILQEMWAVFVINRYVKAVAVKHRKKRRRLYFPVFIVLYHSASSQP